jgi:hypothetical protein
VAALAPFYRGAAPRLTDGRPARRALGLEQIVSAKAREQGDPVENGRRG